MSKDTHDFSIYEAMTLANNTPTDRSIGTARRITSPEAQRLIHYIQRQEDPIWAMLDGIAEKASKVAMDRFARKDINRNAPTYYDVRMLIRDLEK